MMRSLISGLVVLLISLSASSQNCEGPLRSGADFYRCAIQKDPRIMALNPKKDEREGRVREAKQIPNPLIEAELGLGSENQQSIAVVQPIEIGGKRSARIKIAEAENLASQVEDELTLSEVAMDLVSALVRYRQLKVQSSFLEEMKSSLTSTIQRLGAKTVRTPEEKNALSIFSMQSSVIETQLLSVKQEFSEIRTELETAIGRKLTERDDLSLPEKKDWPIMDASKFGETFEAKLSRASVEKAVGELDLQESLGWPDVAIGPMMERREGIENSWGAKVEISLPIFHLNGGAKQRTRAELQRARLLAGRSSFREAANLKSLLHLYNDTAKFLKTSPSQSEIRKSVTESLQLFKRGMIQPAAIVETYRSSLETLDAVQGKELAAYRLYWRLQSFSGSIPKELL